MNVSVYITSYNQCEFLKVAISSVLNQTLQPCEIIIVDDASTDDSQLIIKDFANQNPIIKYLFHTENKGVVETRRTALAMIKGDLVTYVDGDDIYLPNKLEIEFNLLKETNSDLVFSNNTYVMEEDTEKELWTWIEPGVSIDLDSNLFLKTLTRDYPRSSLFRMEMVRRSLLEEVGFHDTNLKIYEDYDLRIRLSKIAKMAYSDEVTSKIRVSTSGLSKSNREVHLESLKYIFDKYRLEVDNLDDQTRKKVISRQEQILDIYREKKKEKSGDFLKRISGRIKRMTRK